MVRAAGMRAARSGSAAEHRRVRVEKDDFITGVVSPEKCGSCLRFTFLISAPRGREALSAKIPERFRVGGEYVKCRINN